MFLDMFIASITDAHLVGMPLTIRCDGHHCTGLEAQSCFSALDQTPTNAVRENWSFNFALHPGVLLPAPAAAVSHRTTLTKIYIAFPNQYGCIIHIICIWITIDLI